MDLKKISLYLKERKAVRFLLSPIVNIKKAINRRNFSKSKDAATIRMFKNTHLGERCFIIGNGPSLTPEDLTLLKNEFTFASNRIYYMFDRTKWRPSVYMCSDADVLIEEISTIKKLQLPNKFVSLTAKKFGRRQEDNINYFFIDGKFLLDKKQDVQTEVSEDVSHHFSKTRTVTCSAIEFAIYMGFKKIYLLGCDHSYAITQYSDGRIVKNENVNNYFKGMEGSQSIAIHPIDKATECYHVCRDYADAHGIMIYNATRGGKLEVFERVSLDDVMEVNI